MKKLLLILFVLVFISLKAQENYPKNDFRSPLDIPLYLSGTFGEPRTTHFHGGLDLKTEGVEGKNVYAIGDGFVSRIKVSGYGYGNAIYITHTNGYTSVCGHLSKFNDEIAAWVKTQQENLTSFELDLEHLDPSLFPVKKGDIVAKSGNTGGSQGPHVHFEIRDSLENTINPFLFGFDIKVQDNIKPSLFNLVAYNLSGDRQFSNSKTIKISGSGGNYTVAETLKLNKDAVGFGINTTDKANDVSNNNGIYDIKMYLDGELMYNYQINKFSFDEGRYVYSQCDYWLKVNNYQNVHKCFVEPGNKLDSYKYLNNNGYIFLYDFEVHNVRIEVSDFHKNTSTLNYKIQRDDSSAFFQESSPSFQEVLVQGKVNWFKNDDIALKLPENALFDDVYFKITKEARTGVSDGFQVGDIKTPIFGTFDISLKAKQLNEVLKDKYLLVYKNYRNILKAVGGIFNDETKIMQAETKGFGYYYISIDTIPPVISSLSVSSGKTMTNYKAIQFKITDNLSGIETYDLFINGTWAVLELDGKNALYTYYIDEKVVKGNNQLTLVVKDERNNARTYSVEFVY